MWNGANNEQVWLPRGEMSDSETCSNRLQLDLMLILENFLCELNSHIIIWPFRLNITFGWLQKLNPGYEICIISYQVNLYSEVSAMFNSLMPSLNSRSLPFVVFLGGFPSRCQNLSSGAIRPGGLLFIIFFNLKKLKSSISQYLFRIFFSILAYIFLRVVFMSYIEVCARKLL